ncbi:MAG: cytochrome c [Gemmatimonadetes bacterium]|nr:cytochrome c [Gemmatimonadota bacterium]
MTHASISRAFWSGAVLALFACGGDAPATDDGSAGSAGSIDADGLTAVELEQGIGPVRDLELGAIDPALVAEGETLFTTKCSACHKIEERYVAPALGDVLARRRPEFVMNMMLNANEMVLEHPTIQELLAEFYTPMPVQITERAQARAILEYLRSVQTDPSPDASGA